jgi:hypothetical protein
LRFCFKIFRIKNKIKGQFTKILHKFPAPRILISIIPILPLSGRYNLERDSLQAQVGIPGQWDGWLTIRVADPDPFSAGSGSSKSEF